MANTYDLKQGDDETTQCQAIARGGKSQCSMQRVEGSDYCPIHGGGLTIIRNQKEALRNYRKGVWLQSIADKSEASAVKSLREEIGISRVIVEEILDRCDTAEDLIANASLLNETISRINNLVLNCHKIDTQLGLMMDREHVISLATAIVSIIDNHIEDKTLVAMISDEIQGAVTHVTEAIEDAG